MMNRASSTIVLVVTVIVSIAALGVAIFAPANVSVDVPWAFLGATVGVDETARTFLFFTAILWGGAAVYGLGYFKSEGRAGVYHCFFLSAMLGNLGVIFAQDAITFYVFFALMSFASYGLVVFNGDAFARRAGRIYMILVVLGEVALFGGLVGLYAESDLGIALPSSDLAVWSPATVALIAGGFGVKAGALALHLWLPLAHPAAPVPASAVLSGAMIKAGLLGWMRFLPVGEIGFENWGAGFIVAGIAAAFFGLVVGLVQTNPKTILAYSSISQMGFMTIAVGAGLLSPEIWPICQIAVLAYAWHHGLSKGALFLGTGIAPGGLARWGWVGIALPSLSLAGAPFMSGAAAKNALKAAIGKLPGDWPVMLATLLPLAAIGTGVLMVRFLFVLRRYHPMGHGEEDRRPMVGAWGVVIGISILVMWFWSPISGFAWSSLKLSKVWHAMWPVGGAGLVGGIVWWRQPRVLSCLTGAVPAGDLVVVFERMVDAAASFARRLTFRSLGRRVADLLSSFNPGSILVRQIEKELGRWGLAISLFFTLILILFLLLTFD